MKEFNKLTYKTLHRDKTVRYVRKDDYLFNLEFLNISCGKISEYRIEYDVKVKKRN